MALKKKTGKEQERTIDKPVDDEASGSWAKDQSLRGYYYDDSHGYQKYDPAESEDEAEDEADGKDE